VVSASLMDSHSNQLALQVWNVESGHELRAFQGRFPESLKFAINPDGTRMALTSWDKSLRIWDLETGRELITLEATSAPVIVIWTADGKRLLSAQDDGIIQVYAMDIDLLMSLARTRVTRSFTPEECRKYLHKDVPYTP
jgi:WD40 repeat protein